MSHPNPRGRGGGTRGQGQSKRGAKGKSRAIPAVDEDGQEMGPAVGTGTSKKNITWEKNHSHRTSRLIAWCKSPYCHFNALNHCNYQANLMHQPL
jgi:hypothetical protein